MTLHDGLTGYHRYARTRARLRRYTGVVSLGVTKREECCFFRHLENLRFTAIFTLAR